MLYYATVSLLLFSSIHFPGRNTNTHSRQLLLLFCLHMQKESMHVKQHAYMYLFCAVLSLFSGDSVTNAKPACVAFSLFLRHSSDCVCVYACASRCIQVGLLAFTCASGAAAAVTHSSPQGCFLSHCDKLIFGKFTSVHRVRYLFTVASSTGASYSFFLLRQIDSTR